MLEYVFAANRQERGNSLGLEAICCAPLVFSLSIGLYLVTWDNGCCHGHFQIQQSNLFSRWLEFLDRKIEIIDQNTVLLSI